MTVIRRDLRLTFGAGLQFVETRNNGCAVLTDGRNQVVVSSAWGIRLGEAETPTRPFRLGLSRSRNIEREIEVLRLRRDGLTYPEIADRVNTNVNNARIIFERASRDEKLLVGYTALCDLVDSVFA